MLGRMPTPQVITLLKASGPAKAAATLLTFPGDRIGVLLAAMPPADLAGVLAASTAAQRSQLLPGMTAEKTLLVLAELTTGQVADVLAAMPPAPAAALLSAAPAPEAGRILSVLPEGTRVAVLELMAPDRAADVLAARYEQRVINSVSRITRRVFRLPWPTCDLTAGVLHRSVHVAVRYHGRRALADQEVWEVATAADWNNIAGIAVVTDAELTDAVLRYGSTVDAAGYPLELLRWTSEEDDGALKRALVRLGG